MLKKVTIEKLHGMRLSGMVAALEQQARSSEHARLDFEDRFGLLVDAEWEAREGRKLTNRLRQAKLRYAASIEDVDYNPRRGLDRKVVLSLATCQWIRERQSLIVTGATGTGKSWLACAFVERACRSGFSALYVRTNRLLHDLAVARGDGSYRRVLVRLAKLDLLALDDWLLNPLSDAERRDMHEVLEDRSEQCSTLITTQRPVKSWHEAVGEASVGDALCDRIVHAAHRIALKGPSMREVRAAKAARAAAAE